MLLLLINCTLLINTRNTEMMSHFSFVRCSEHYLLLKRQAIESKYVWKYLKWSKYIVALFVIESASLNIFGNVCVKSKHKTHSWRNLIF